VFNGLLGVLAAAGWQTLLLTLTLRYRFHSPAHDATDRTMQTAAVWASLPVLFATTFIVILRAKGTMLAPLGF